ncbi:hypothetical protein F4810DRAFT_671424 [Camillea tinctor]|nr:hypothetical protein F4810DRAFT_671424 [Camillea tinctor]
MASNLPSSVFVCTNWTRDNQQCSGAGKYACKGCYLVLYCGRHCQRSHWNTHKADCRHALMNSRWLPQWGVERRKPKFNYPDNNCTASRTLKRKSWWSLTPAFDILKLESNEGADYKNDLDLLFAYAIDLNNVVKTVASIPTDFQNPVNITINKVAENTLIRDVPILVFAMLEEDKEIASEGIIHLWYSAFIPKSLRDNLISKMKKVVDIVMSMAEDPQNLDTIIDEPIKLGLSTIQVRWSVRNWLHIQSLIEAPIPLSAEEAQQIRQQVSLNPNELDERELHYYCQPEPSNRLCLQRFREDGILLPFGTPRDESLVLNPTMCWDSKKQWMDGIADPLNGWMVWEYVKVPCLAKNDIYGKLFIFLKNLLSRFHHRITHFKTLFRVLAVSPLALPLLNATLDRIEMGNLTDYGDPKDGKLGNWMAMERVGNNLKQSAVNPHATAISLYYHLIEDFFRHNPSISSPQPEEYLNAMLYRLVPPIWMTEDHPGLIRFRMGWMFMREVEEYFNSYMECTSAEPVLLFLGLQLKEENTVIEPWPTRPRKELARVGPGNFWPGAIAIMNDPDLVCEVMKEYYILLGRSNLLNGTERYAEWKRVPDWEDPLESDPFK